MLERLKAYARSLDSLLSEDGDTITLDNGAVFEFAGDRIVMRCAIIGHDRDQPQVIGLRNGNEKIAMDMMLVWWQHCNTLTALHTVYRNSEPLALFGSLDKAWNVAERMRKQGLTNVTVF